MSEVKKTTATELPVEQILAAKFNTHVKEKRTDEEFQGLCRNIRELGLINRVVVRPLPESGSYEIVDGHRRFAAIKALGWKMVPVDIREEDDKDAIYKQVSANIQRTDNDVILQAQQLGNAQRKGDSNSEIAQKLGKSVAWVTQHARVTSLIEEWRTLAKNNDFTVDCLVRIAAYDPEIQRKVFNANHSSPNDELEGQVRWEDYESEFHRCLMDLDEVPFDTAACATCPNNSACCKFLFPDLDEESQRCQNETCFREKWNAAVDEMLVKFRKSGIDVIQVAAKYKIPNYWDTSATKSKKHPQPYIYEDDGLRHIVFGEAKAQQEDATIAKTREEIQAERAAKKAEKIRLGNINAARDKIREALQDHAEQERIVDKVVKTAEFKEWARREFLDIVRGYRDPDACDCLYRFIGANWLGITLTEDEKRDYEAQIEADAKAEEAEQAAKGEEA